MKLSRRIDDYVVVTVVAALIWLWAESSNVAYYPADGSYAPVSLTVEASAPRLIVTDQTPKQVNLRFRGSQGQIGRLRQALQGGLTVSPDGLKVGQSSLNVQDLVGTYDEMEGLAVNVVSVDPATVAVTVDELEDVVATVRFDPGLLVLDGPWRADPATVKVTLPSEKESELNGPEGSHWVSIRPIADVSKLPAGQEQTVAAKVVLPVSGPNVKVEPEEVRLTLVVDKQEQDLVVPSVPVVVQLLPSDVSRFDVTMADDSATISNVSVIGPSNIIERVRSLRQPLVAVLKLSTDDLTSAANSGAEQTGTATIDLPVELRFVTNPSTTVTYSVRRKDQ